MNNDAFKLFDNACIGGDLATVKTILATTKFKESQLNTALRHAAYYTNPNRDIREEVIDELIEHGAKVDWTDHGIETITNAFEPRNPYVLKKILNVCDGNRGKLAVALETVSHKKDAQWAMDLIEARMISELHIGF
jgi:hypothetical protein